MSDKYIKFEDAQDLLERALEDDFEISYAVDRLKELPVVDALPIVHGQWIYEEPNGANSFKGAYYCDQCHQPEIFRRNFCPECGADMRDDETAIS